MGLVGESGSGKSVTAKSLMKLNPGNAIYSDDTKITLHLDSGPVDVMSLQERAGNGSRARRGDLDDLPGTDGQLSPRRSASASRWSNNCWSIRT